MTFTESIQTCFTKYADFNGKASRSEFWWWALFNFIAGICLSIIDQRLAWAFTVATLLPYLTVSTRRLHDVDRSGWWQLIGLVPFVGHVAPNFILLHPSGKAFVFCQREDLSSRMAPFMRVGEGV